MVSAKKLRKWEYGPNINTDERFTKPHKPKAKKNANKWCKGKVGREHVVELERHTYWSTTECGPSPTWWNKRSLWTCIHEKVCTVCGKRLGSVGWKNCPDRPESLRTEG